MKPTKNNFFCLDSNKTKMRFETEKKALNFIKFSAFFSVSKRILVLLLSKQKKLFLVGFISLSLQNIPQQLIISF